MADKTDEITPDSLTEDELDVLDSLIINTYNIVDAKVVDSLTENELDCFNNLIDAIDDLLYTNIKENNELYAELIVRHLLEKKYITRQIIHDIFNRSKTVGE